MTMKTFQLNKKTAVISVIIVAVLLIALVLFVSARTQAERTTLTEGKR